MASTDWEKLRELCLDAFKSCDHLVLNIEKITEYDYSFSVLVCLLRRTAQLLSKRLSIEGKEDDYFICVYEAALRSSTMRCSFTGANLCCLWENLFTNSSFRGLNREGELRSPPNSGGGVPEEYEVRVVPGPLDDAIKEGYHEQESKADVGDGAGGSGKAVRLPGEDSLKNSRRSREK